MVTLAASDSAFLSYHLFAMSTFDAKIICTSWFMEA